jgi:hypothetical protein
MTKPARLARLTWFSLMITSLAVFIWAVPARYNQMMTDPYGLEAGLKSLGLSLRQLAIYTTVLDILVGAACWSFGLLLFVKKPQDRLVWLLSLAIGMLLTSALPVTNALSAASAGWKTPLLLLRMIGTFSLTGAVILFPDGKFIPRWTRFMFLAAVVYIVLWLFVPGLAPFNTLDFRSMPSTTSLVAQFIFFLMIAAIQIYRYRYVSNPVQRLQTRWIVLGLVLLVGTISAIAMIGIFWEPLRTSPTIFALYLILEIPIVLFSLLLFPITVAIAIMRYHLWDIDALIRRTLVYSLLTGLLAVIYFSGVALLQGVLNTERGQPSPVVIVITTLLIYVLFSPMRRRIQDFIDRRFYRQKYDAEKALAEFASAARSSTELSSLTNNLVDLVCETLQPASIKLWFTKDLNQHTTEKS